MAQLSTKTTVLGADEFAAHVRRLANDAETNLLGAVQDISVKWEYEAKLRIPVDTGEARNQTFGKSGLDSEGVYATVENNAEYASFLEFGTRYIAGGAVLAIGDKEEVTDAEAVHWWPAKAANLEEKRTSVAHRGGKLIGAMGGAALGSQRAQEQMPWLRTSFMAIKDWAIKRIIRAFDG